MSKAIVARSTSRTIEFRECNRPASAVRICAVPMHASRLRRGRSVAHRWCATTRPAARLCRPSCPGRSPIPGGGAVELAVQMSRPTGRRSRRRSIGTGPSCRHSIHRSVCATSWWWCSALTATPADRQRSGTSFSPDSSARPTAAPSAPSRHCQGPARWAADRDRALRERDHPVVDHRLLPDPHGKRTVALALTKLGDVGCTTAQECAFASRSDPAAPPAAQSNTRTQKSSPGSAHTARQL
jgi:hypothetical protein